MKYQDGKLTVPTTGRYYIYAQVYYHNRGRVYLSVNHKIVSMIQPPVLGKDTGAQYTGGVFELKAGDFIKLTGGDFPAPPINKIYMYTLHTFFGAYLL